MRLPVLAAACLSLVVAARPARAQTSRNPAMRAATFRVGTDSFSAWVYVPSDSARRPSEGWPLIVAMHGLGELGTNLDQLRSASGSLPNVIDNGLNPEFVVVMPQVNWNRDDTFAASFMGAAIALGQSSAPVDRCRVHVTGLSMGVGYAAAFMLARSSEAASWSLMSNRCWGTTPTDAQWAAMAEVPSWHSQTIGDATGCMIGMVNNLRRVRPSTSASSWLYCSSAPNVRSDLSATCSGQTWGHAEGWSIPYAPNSRGLHSPSWWSWVASQRRSSCGPASDAGVADSSVADSGARVDAGPLDSGVRGDASPLDSGGADSSATQDASARDEGTDAMDAIDAADRTADAGAADDALSRDENAMDTVVPRDAAASDASEDTDAGTNAGAAAGCSCRAPRTASKGTAALWLLALAAMIERKGRR